jgi:hypothetical protein
MNEKGVEQTTEFGIAGWWLTDNISFEHQRPSEFFIQAVEGSEVLCIEHVAQQELLNAYPKMERYFRFVYQRAYAAAQMRIKYLYDLSKEEMFHHFSQHYPDFVNRIPQHLRASFLGFTPEYLSEIRKKSLLNQFKFSLCGLFHFCSAKNKMQYGKQSKHRRNGTESLQSYVRAGSLPCYYTDKQNAQRAYQDSRITDQWLRLLPGHAH